MSENEISTTSIELKGVARLRRQALRMELIPVTDFKETSYTIRTTGKKVQVLQLTESGKDKRQLMKEKFFGSTLPMVDVPLGDNFDFESDISDKVMKIDGLLALSLIRRRTGRYVCSFTDDFAKLGEEQYLARVMSINSDKQTARIIFDHWPGEYINHEYVAEKANLLSINEPVSIGPECVINLQILRDGKPHEDIIGWAKNVINRNILRKGS